MIGNTLVRKAVQVEYALVRAPLAALDERVVARYLATDSPVRVTFERGLDSFDAAVAKLLHTTGAGTSQADVRPGEEQHEVEELATGLLQQEENETFAGELVDDEMRRVQAELRAKHIVAERHQQIDSE